MLHPQNVDDHILYALAAFHDEDSDSCAGALHKALALNEDQPYRAQING